MVNEKLFWKATLKERILFTETLGRFKFELEEDFSFSPGQFATIGLENQQEKLIQRPYSIVSSPDEKELEFFIELVPDGKLTPLIFAMKVGDQARIRRKINGTFTLLDMEEKKNLLLVGTKTGLAPYVSMLRKLTVDYKGQEFPYGRIGMLVGVSRSEEMGDYLSELNDFREYSWFDFIPTVSRPWEDEVWSGEWGRVEDVLRKYMDDWEFSPENSLVFLCGNTEMVKNATNVLKRFRFEKEQIRTEKYF